MKHRCTRYLAAFCGLLGAAQPVLAQSYPARPIRLVVPFPAGGGSDTAARSLAVPLGARLKQQIVVDNRPGAAGTIGTEYASRAAPDGYTLLLGSTSELTLYPALAARPPYDVLRDFVPIALVSDIAFMLVVHPSLPAHSLREFIDLAKKRPGQIHYGSAGYGATSHLTLALLGEMTGIDLVHVPYKGTPPAAADLLGGHLQALMPPMPSVLPYTRNGRLRPLAVSSVQRWPTVPDVPTVAESGLAGYEVVLWTGVLAPANTPAEIVARLHREIAHVLEDPAVVQAFGKLGAVVRLLGPPEFDAYMKQELARWAEVGKRTGIRIN